MKNTWKLCIINFKRRCFPINKILIVEDDKTIAKLIQASLSISDYESIICYDGNEAYDFIMTNTVDLILLDIMLPGMDGFSLFERIQSRNIPVIFLTAKSDVADRVKGLKLGADDYILKPFEPLELLARVETVLRRYKKTEKTLIFRNITINLEERTAKLDNIIVDVTPLEYDLLVLFIRRKNIALSRDTILELVWGISVDIETRTVDNHVQRIRKKFNLEDCLKTVFKIGYRLEG